MDYAAELIEKAGVAIVPGCGFFHKKSTHSDRLGSSDLEVSGGKEHDYTRRYIRVAFCKDLSTLKSAAEGFQACNLWCIVKMLQLSNSIM